MKIVIDVPEDEYNAICSGTFDTDGYFRMNLSDTFKSGIPLPKGHGRLIDERQINECKQVGLVIQDGVVTRCLVTDAPTIIEAERQSLKQIKRAHENNK